MELIDTFYERWNAFTAALQPLAAWLQDAWASITRIFKRLVKWARSVISTHKPRRRDYVPAQRRKAAYVQAMIRCQHMERHPALFLQRCTARIGRVGGRRR